MILAKLHSLWKLFPLNHQQKKKEQDKCVGWQLNSNETHANELNNEQLSDLARQWILRDKPLPGLLVYPTILSPLSPLLLISQLQQELEGCTTITSTLWPSGSVKVSFYVRGSTGARTLARHLPLKRGISGDDDSSLTSHWRQSTTGRRSISWDNCHGHGNLTVCPSVFELVKLKPKDSQRENTDTDANNVQ
ncbi:hypothetical protein ACLKA6_000315 [Drosophila palustris]